MTICYSDMWVVAFCEFITMYMYIYVVDVTKSAPHLSGVHFERSEAKWGKWSDFPYFKN